MGMAFAKWEWEWQWEAGMGAVKKELSGDGALRAQKVPRERRCRGGDQQLSVISDRYR
jgi:hypothetical protein